MHWKLAVTLVLVTVGLTQSQPEQGGELFASVDDCSPGSVVQAPEIKDVLPVNNRITVGFSTEEPSENLYYVVLLTTDLSIPLDNAASLAREGADNNARTGRILMVNARVTGEQTSVPVLLSTENRNDRFYVAVMLYRCSWEAHTPDRVLARSGWRLHETDGVPQTVGCADPLEELPYAQAYTLTDRPGGPGLFYLRISAPSEQMEITAYEPKDADTPNKAGTHKNEIFKLASLSSTDQTAVVSSIPDACRLVESREQFKNLIIAQGNGVYHLFRYFEKTPSAPVEIKAVDSRKGVRRTSVAFSSFTAWRGFVDALSAYSRLSAEDDPATATVNIRDISPEQKTVQAALTFLAMPTDFHSTLEDKREGVLGSYLNRVDNITRNWSSVAGSLERIANLALEANKQAVKRPISVVNNGPFALFGEKDTARVVYRHAFARLDFSTKLHNPYTEEQNSGLGILWRLSPNAQLYSYDPDEEEVNPFTTFLNGIVEPYEVYRITGEQATTFEENGIWLKGNTEPAEDDIEIAVEVRPVALVPKPAPEPEQEAQAFFFEGGFGAEVAAVEATEEQWKEFDWEQRKASLFAVKEKTTDKISLRVEKNAQGMIPLKEQTLKTLPNQDATIKAKSNEESTPRHVSYQIITPEVNRAKTTTAVGGGNRLDFFGTGKFVDGDTYLQAKVQSPNGGQLSHVFQWKWDIIGFGFPGMDENNTRTITLDYQDSYTGFQPDELFVATAGTVRMRVSGDIEIFGEGTEYSFIELSEKYSPDSKDYLEFDMTILDHRLAYKGLLGNLAVRTHGARGVLELSYVPPGSNKEWLSIEVVFEAVFDKAAKLTLDYNGDLLIDEKDDDMYHEFPHRGYEFWSDPRERIHHSFRDKTKHRRERQVLMKNFSLLKILIPDENMFSWFDRFELRIGKRRNQSQDIIDVGHLVNSAIDPNQHFAYLMDTEYAQVAEKNLSILELRSDAPVTIAKTGAEGALPHSIGGISANTDFHVLFAPRCTGEIEVMLYGINEEMEQQLLLSTAKLDITPVSENIVVYSARTGRYDEQEHGNYQWEGPVIPPSHPYPQDAIEIAERTFPTPSHRLTAHTYKRGKGITEKFKDLDYNSPENIFFYTHGFADPVDETIQSAKNYYKTLFWLGFPGQVVLFTWPGDWPVGSNWLDRALFSLDQWIAFMCSPAALEVLQNIKSNLQRAGNDKSEIIALVHSLGNHLMADAMRVARWRNQPFPVDRYYFYEAAVWTNAFYPPPPNVEHQRLHQILGWEFLYFEGFRAFLKQKPGAVWNLFNPEDWALNTAMRKLDESGVWGNCGPLSPVPFFGYPDYPEYYSEKHDYRNPYRLALCLKSKPHESRNIPDMGSPRAEPMGMAEHSRIPDGEGGELNLKPVDTKEHLDQFNNEIAPASGTQAHSYLTNRPLWAIRGIFEITGLHQ